MKIALIVLSTLFCSLSPLAASTQWEELRSDCLDILKKSYSSNQNLQKSAREEANKIVPQLKTLLEKTATNTTERTNFDYVCGLRVLALTETEKQWALGQLKTVSEDSHYPLLSRLMGWNFIETKLKKALSEQFLDALNEHKIFQMTPKNATPFWQDQTVQRTPTKIPLAEVSQIYCDILTFWSEQSEETRQENIWHIHLLSTKAATLVQDPNYAIHERFKLCYFMHQAGYKFDQVEGLLSTMASEIGIKFNTLKPEELARCCTHLTDSFRKIIDIRDQINSKLIKKLDRTFNLKCALIIKDDLLNKLKTYTPNSLNYCFGLRMLGEFFTGKGFNNLQYESQQEMELYLDSNEKDRYIQLISLWCKFPDYFKESKKKFELFPQIFFFPFDIYSKSADKFKSIESNFSQALWTSLTKSQIDEKALNLALVGAQEFLEGKGVEKDATHRRALEFINLAYADPQIPSAVQKAALAILDRYPESVLAYEKSLSLDHAFERRKPAIEVINQHIDAACFYLQGKTIDAIKPISIYSMIKTHKLLETQQDADDQTELISWAVKNVAHLGVSDTFSLQESFKRWHALKQAGCNKEFIFQLMDHTVSMIKDKFNNLKKEELLEYCQSLKKNHKAIIKFKDEIDTRCIEKLYNALETKSALIIKDDLQNKLKTFKENYLGHCFGLWMLGKLFKEKGEEFKGLKKQSVQKMEEYFNSDFEECYSQSLLFLYKLPMYIDKPKHFLDLYPQFFLFPHSLKSNIYPSQRENIKSKLPKIIRNALWQSKLDEESLKFSLITAQDLLTDQHPEQEKAWMKDNKDTIHSQALKFITQICIEPKISSTVKIQAGMILDSCIKENKECLPLKKHIKIRQSAIEIIKSHLESACSYLKGKKINEIRPKSFSQMFMEHLSVTASNNTQSLIEWAVDTLAPLTISDDYPLEESFKRWYALKMAGCKKNFIFQLMDHTFSIIKGKLERLQGEQLDLYCQNLRKSTIAINEFIEQIKLNYSSWGSKVKKLNTIVPIYKQKCALAIKQYILSNLDNFEDNTLVSCLSLWMLEDLFCLEDDFKGLKDKSSKKMAEYFNANLENCHSLLPLLWCELPLFFSKPEHFLEHLPEFFIFPVLQMSSSEYDFKQALWESLSTSTKIQEGGLMQSLQTAHSLLQENFAALPQKCHVVFKGNKQEIQTRTLEYIARVGATTQFPIAVRTQAKLMLAAFADKIPYEKSLPLDYAIKLRKPAIDIINQHPKQACESLKSKKTDDIKAVSLEEMIQKYITLEETKKANHQTSLIAWAVETIAPLAISDTYSLEESFKRCDALHQSGCNEVFSCHLMEHRITRIKNQFNQLNRHELEECCKKLYKENCDLNEYVSDNQGWERAYSFAELNPILKFYREKSLLVIKDDILKKIDNIDKNILIYYFSAKILKYFFSEYNEEFEKINPDISKKMENYFNAASDDKYTQWLLIYCKLKIFFEDHMVFFKIYPQASLFRSYVSNWYNQDYFIREFKYAMALGVQKAKIDDAAMIKTIEFGEAILQGNIHPFESLTESKYKITAKSKVKKFIKSLAESNDLSYTIRLKAARTLQGHNDQVALEVAIKTFKHYSAKWIPNEQALVNQYQAAKIIVALETNEEDKTAAAQFIVKMDKEWEKKATTYEKTQITDIQEKYDDLLPL